MLSCSKCGEEKDESDFSVRASRPRGHNSQCKACCRLVNKVNYDKNVERNRAAASDYRKRNPPTGSVYQAAYRDAHREELREYFRQYSKENRHKKQATGVARRSKKLNAIPSWVDHVEVAAIYKRSKQIERRCGTKMHVDHIVPLVHPLVCGLHCEANLRVLPAAKNLKKGNRYWPNMP